VILAVLVVAFLWGNWTSGAASPGAGVLLTALLVLAGALAVAS
jgi:hypothetical protein